MEGVYDDTVSIVDSSIWPICFAPALAPAPEGYSWGQQQIDALAAHQQWPRLKGAGVIVAVLATGIDSYPELRIAERYNARAGAHPSDYQRDKHGTHMAGITAEALNSPGIIGVAPQRTLLAVKVLAQYGAGYLSDVIDGLQWVSNSGIRLANISVGFSTDSLPLQQVIQSLYTSGVIMVTHAGNRCAESPAQDEGGGDRR